MGMFGNIVIFLIGVNVLLGLFGVVNPDSSLISSLISGNITPTFLWDFFSEALNPANGGGIWATIFGIGAATIGVVTKRDELIYGPLFVALLSLAGVFNFFKEIPLFGVPIYIGMIILTTWAGIEWLRGKD